MRICKYTEYTQKNLSKNKILSTGYSSYRAFFFSFNKGFMKRSPNELDLNRHGCQFVTDVKLLSQVDSCSNEYAEHLPSVKFIKFLPSKHIFSLFTGNSFDLTLNVTGSILGNSSRGKNKTKVLVNYPPTIRIIIFVTSKFFYAKIKRQVVWVDLVGKQRKCIYYWNTYMSAGGTILVLTWRQCSFTLLNLWKINIITPYWTSSHDIKGRCSVVKQGVIWAGLLTWLGISVQHVTYIGKMYWTAFLSFI